MRAPKEAGEAWERTLTRFFAAHGVPLRWDYVSRRFHGLAGHNVARINPAKEDNVWQNMPQYVRKYEYPDRNKESKQVMVFVTNKRYGDSVDDTLVVMRLGTLMPMLKSMVDKDPERWKE